MLSVEDLLNVSMCACGGVLGMTFLLGAFVVAIEWTALGSETAGILLFVLLSVISLAFFRWANRIYVAA